MRQSLLLGIAVAFFGAVQGSLLEFAAMLPQCGVGFPFPSTQIDDIRLTSFPSSSWNVHSKSYHSRLVRLRQTILAYAVIMTCG